MPKTSRQKKDTNSFLERKHKMEPNDCLDNESVENLIQGRDVVPQNSLSTYKEARDLINPLKDYIRRINNEQALARIREVESVIKYVIKNEKRPKKPNN